MALITLPDGLNNIAWAVPQAVQFVVRSDYSPTPTIINRGTYRRGFTASCDVAAQSADDVRAWRLFFMQATDLENTFTLPAVKAADQAAVTPASVAAVGGSTGTALLTKGWARGGVETVMTAGQVISHAGVLHVLETDATSGAGGNNDRATLTVRPPLRATSVADAVVLVREPVATMRLTAVQGGWEMMLSHYQPVGFAAEEVL